MRATNARSYAMIPVRGYVPYGPLSRICMRNPGLKRAFALRTARRPVAPSRDVCTCRNPSDGLSAECEPANNVSSVPDEPPLHLQLQELVEERVRLVRGLSVVKEREELLVSGAEVPKRVVGLMPEAKCD